MNDSIHVKDDSKGRDISFFHWSEVCGTWQGDAPSYLPSQRTLTLGHWGEEAKLAPSAGLMPTEARGSYLPEPPYLRETRTYHSQPLESTRHARNYFIPLSIRPIFIFCCRSYVKLLDYWRAEKFSLLPEASLRPVAFATWFGLQ